MKVVIDEHLPPALARALFAGQHEVVHLRQRFGAGVTDVEWIGTLSREGGWVVISADRWKPGRICCLPQVQPDRILSIQGAE